VSLDLHKFNHVKNLCEKARIKKELLEQDLNKLKKQEVDLDTLEKCQHEAKTVIQQVAAETQGNLKIHITTLVTSALKSIFEDEKEFKMLIEQRRNQTEIDFFIDDNGNLQEPLDSDGFGLVNVLSLALRIAYWCLKKNRRIFILDEPFRDLSKGYSKNASALLKRLCDELGVQMIIVSHNQGIAEHADKTFLVEKVRKKSQLSTR